MYLAYRIISASAVLGFFISRAISKNDLILLLLFPLILISAALSMVFFQSTAEIGNREIFINLAFGIFFGVVLSAPVIIISLLSENIAAYFKNKPSISFKTVIVLALLLQLFNLDYLPYFFSLILKSSAMTDLDLSLEQVGDFGTLLFSSFAYYALPCLILFLASFILFCATSILSPSVATPGFMLIVKMIIAFSLLIFYFSHSSSFFYDLMKTLDGAIAK